MRCLNQTRKRKEKQFYLSTFFKKKIQKVNVDDILEWLNCSCFQNKIVKNERKLDFWSVFFSESDYKDTYPTFRVFTYKLYQGSLQVHLEIDSMKRVKKAFIVMDSKKDGMVMFEFNLLTKQLTLDSKINLRLPNLILHRFQSYNPSEITRMFAIA
jgi:hypothetical protein